MATLKQRLHRKNGSSYDIVHLETESNVVMRPSGNTVETDLTNYLPKVQNSDDVPEGLNPGQVSIGPTKGYYCTGDGSVKEFGKGSGGGLDSKVPTLGVDFSYSGNCEVIDDSTDSNTNWRIKFYTSGTLRVSSDVAIDIFAVGGGGGGGKAEYDRSAGGGGGGGGYTSTIRNVLLEKETDYTITIGDGGAYGRIDYGGTGGTSTLLTCTAIGGKGGTPGSINYPLGGDGGSGGGAGGNQTNIAGGNGGSDGSHGTKVGLTNGGNGQGTTTREFGESTGDLYAGGGGGAGGKNASSGTNSGNGLGGDGGGGHSGIAGTTNSGGGGSGGRPNTSLADKFQAGAGGSGIVVIRKTLWGT